MKNNSLMHPIEALFIKIPLDNMFQNNYNDEEIKNENIVKKESELKYGMILLIESEK